MSLCFKVLRMLAACLVLVLSWVHSHREKANLVAPCAQDSEEHSPAAKKLQIQIADWRDALGCHGPFQSLQPWTSQKKRYLGLNVNATARVKAILDCAILEVLGGAAKVSSLSPEEITSCMDGTLVDVSQNPCRKSFSNQGGQAKCMTTSSSLYSFW